MVWKKLWSSHPLDQKGEHLTQSNPQFKKKRTPSRRGPCISWAPLSSNPVRWQSTLKNFCQIPITNTALIATPERPLMLQLGQELSSVRAVLSSIGQPTEWMWLMWRTSLANNGMTTNLLQYRTNSEETSNISTCSRSMTIRICLFTPNTYSLHQSIWKRD